MIAIIQMFSTWVSQLMNINGQFGWMELLTCFILIFIETGGIFTGFIPGDTLLMTAGSFAGLHHDGVELALLILVFGLASLCGDAVNYYFGAWILKQASRIPWVARHLKQDFLNHLAQHFNHRRWLLFVILGRFIPFIRTIVPLTVHRLGLSFKSYLKMAALASFLWASVISMVGYYFGQLELPHGLNWIIMLIVLFLLGMIVTHPQIKNKIMNVFMEKVDK